MELGFCLFRFGCFVRENPADFQVLFINNLAQFGNTSDHCMLGCSLFYLKRLGLCILALTTVADRF